MKMNNFQLYKTCIPLSGQVKWDLTLESARDENGYGVLFVNDFKLTPISRHIPFSDKNILNYSHLENLKEYYNRLENLFFKPCPNPDLDSLIPYIYDDVLNDNGKLDLSHKSVWKDLHDSTIEMGISRSKYGKTGKQFEFFCPVWIEHFDPSVDVLSFKFALRTITNREQSSNNQEIITKSLIFKPSSIWPYHTKVVNYFNNYTKDAELTSRSSGGMGEDLLSVNINKKSATISGIDVRRGVNIKSKQIDSLVDDLCSTERLLMDFDNILIKNFQHNLIIARQLINFNFIFDADEFITPNILNMMYGANFEMDVHVEINGEELPMKDFYTNYDFIPRKPIGYLAKNTHIEQEQNIFDLIKDHQNISLTCKNKMSPHIFHWALEGNNDYIFNLYTGFGGYSLREDNKEPEITPYNYQDSPDIWTSHYSDSLGNIDWCYSIPMKTVNDYIEFSQNLERYSDKSIVGKDWCSNIHFNIPDDKKMTYPFPVILLINENPDNFEEGLYALSPEATIIDMPNEYKKLLGDKYETNSLEGLGLVEFGGPGSIKCIVCNRIQLNSVTFSNIRYGLTKFIQDFNQAKDLDKKRHDENPEHPLHDYDIKQYIEDITKTFSCGLGWMADNYETFGFAQWINFVDDPIVVDMKLLGYVSAKGPVREISEVEHVKVSESTGKIFRYDGNLKPCFIDMNDERRNYLYFKTGVFKSQLIYTPFVSYANSGYSAQYPSIGYYPYTKYRIDNINNRDVQLVDIDSGESVDVKTFMPYEYKLYNASKVLLLHNYMELEITLNPKDKDIYSEIKDMLHKTYDISTDKAEYIFNLYDVDLNWDYTYPDNTSIYTYRIKLTLK